MTLSSSNHPHSFPEKILYGEDKQLAKDFRRMMDQDVTYVLSLDREFLDSTPLNLLKQIKQISWSKKPYNIRLKKKLVSEFENVMRRLYYDQTFYDDRLNRPIRPRKIARKIDRVTTQGLARMAEIFAGESSAYYNYPCYGRSQISPELGDWRLYEELARTSIIESGFASGSGTLVKHGGSFSINEPDADDIYEFGVADMPVYNEYQTLWFRSTIEEPMDHVQGKDVITLSHAAYFVSVSDFEEQLNEGTI